MIYKGGIINAWGKKSAVALDKGFFATLPKLPEVSKEEGEIAWLIYDLQPPKSEGCHYELFRERIVYTLRPAAEDNVMPLLSPEPLEKFEQRIVRMLDETVV